MFTFEELQELLAWVQYGAVNHSDQSSRASVKLLVESLKKKLDDFVK